MNSPISRQIIKLGTKSETLTRLLTVQSFFTIPRLSYFTKAEWLSNKQIIANNISTQFPFKKLAVRSSALYEDSEFSSQAGAYESYLNIDSCDTAAILSAVDAVLSSYPNGGLREDQVLIQEMVENVTASGVIMTRVIDDGSPYYVFNYDDESGITDTITGGIGAHKTVLIYRNAAEEHCQSNRVRLMLKFARELENICGIDSLDIEFAIDSKNKIHLLQLRRIAADKNWGNDTFFPVSRRMPEVEKFVTNLSGRQTGIFGQRTILGSMPDWNPAEIIGTHPSSLAASLYRYLITSDAWCRARNKMGYHPMPSTELMKMIAGSPYIDMRASFNSFLPKGVQKETAEKLVNAWLDRVAQHPELHDKIEFDVVPTIFDFDVEAKFEKNYPDLLDHFAREEYFKQLLKLTVSVINIDEVGSLKTALKSIELLKSYQKREDYLPSNSGTPLSIVSWIGSALKEVIELGTIPFSIIARHGFIAESFLQSLERIDILSNARIEEFKSSFSTVLGDFSRDSHRMNIGEITLKKYMKLYGHLRPGTYDIQASPYYARRDFQNINSTMFEPVAIKEFEFTHVEKENIDLAFYRMGHGHMNAEKFLTYAKLAIQGREYAKFIFTRTLSLVLDMITVWGKHYNLSKEELSLLRIEEIIDTSVHSYRDQAESDLMRRIDRARLEEKSDLLMKLGYLIRGIEDLYVVPIHRSSPNFITDQRVEAGVIHLDNKSENTKSLTGKLICIENADPGFDWIFSQNIAGLITKYGGANSHMAIRCAELQLPAAIGCGDLIFSKLENAALALLSCKERIIR